MYGVTSEAPFYIEAVSEGHDCLYRKVCERLVPKCMGVVQQRICYLDKNRF